MKVEEPATSGYAAKNSVVLHLRQSIVERVESETDVNVLERIYSIIYPKDASYEERFRRQKAMAERYCTPEVAAELEAEGFMVGKACPSVGATFDAEAAIREDERDGNAPQEWLQKMFPEVYA
ncbi:MAG: hypothetical protein IJ692_05880 [Alloprevotella sp.]|nr:hypothetical protein [Alloprevotella sp.]